MASATRARPSAEDRVRAALWFAERGFGIFPVFSTDPDGTCRCTKGRRCDNAGKHPVVPNGFHDATREPDRIRTFLAAAGEPNYGLVPPEGVFALDVDGEGITRLAELETVHGPLPPTLRTTTAHGQHVFLRWPAKLPRPIGQLFGYVTRWGSGANAGYVIGPRSVHATGVEYAPAPESVWDIAEIPDAWARAAVGPRDFVIKVTGAGYELPEHVLPSDSRYEQILKYTAHLYNRGLTKDEMWALVRDQLSPRFDVPLDERELRSRFDRATDRKMTDRLGDRRTGSQQQDPVDPAAFPVPENRGQATLSDLGTVEYVEDLIRPGRIVVWAAEEGSGKSFAVSGELALRIAAAGGDFAESWPVLEQGRVLVLSEMHPDDDYLREELVLQALELDRRAIDDRYYRLDLMTAAGGRPALTVLEWRLWVTEWMRQREVLLLVVDTATGATQVDPWGREIQAVYASLRVMLAEYPRLAVVLIVHLKKPDSRGGDRSISDVLGEWGRWCDVVVLQENDGLDLTRAKLTVRKRVRRERRVLVTKRGGLLIEAIDLVEGLEQAKVPVDDILATIGRHPDLSITQLAEELAVSRRTAGNYVQSLGSHLTVTAGPKGSKRVRLSVPVDSAGNPASGGNDLAATGRVAGRRVVAAATPPIGGEVGGVAAATTPSDDLGAAGFEVVDPGAAIHVDCHFPADHSTAWRRLLDGSWTCAICSGAEGDVA